MKRIQLPVADCLQTLPHIGWVRLHPAVMTMAALAKYIADHFSVVRPRLNEKPELQRRNPTDMDSLLNIDESGLKIGQPGHSSITVTLDRGSMQTLFITVSAGVLVYRGDMSVVEFDASSADRLSVKISGYVPLGVDESETSVRCEPIEIPQEILWNVLGAIAQDCGFQGS
ncbi:MAG: hypothetical protein NT003_01540 [Candidatus Magasanikbacteria bacterium]|nr:hypothetical protein [Candidatus Magasanikbacteria bacterium]